MQKDDFPLQATFVKNNKKTSNDLQTLHRKLKIDTNLTEGELGMNSDDPEG